MGEEGAGPPRAAKWFLVPLAFLADGAGTDNSDGHGMLLIGYPARRRLCSRFETKNRRVQRLGRTCGIKVFA